MQDKNIWDQNHFGYTFEFQKKILITMLQNKGLYDRLGAYIDYRYFENSDLSKIFRALSEFTEKYHGYPTLDSIEEYMSSQDGMTEGIKENLEDIYSADKVSKENVDFIETSMSEFIQCQELKKAIMSSLDDLGDVDKHQQISTRISDALLVGTKLEDLGSDTYSAKSIADRYKARKENKAIKRIPTRWAVFDSIFGGLGNKELFSFLGPSHSGKSMFLINLGVNLLLQLYDVLHISLEMSKEVIEQRYDMSLLGLTKNELKTPLFSDRIRKKMKDKLGRLRVKQFPADVTTPAEIVKLMNHLASAENFVPDVLIIDYADILSSPSKYHEKRHELGAIYRSVRNIAVEYDIAAVTATQMNRGALSKLEGGKLLDESDIAEAYDIMRILDAAVSINSSIDDRHNNRALLYVVKNRDGDVGQKISFYVDWSKAYAREWDGK